MFLFISVAQKNHTRRTIVSVFTTRSQRTLNIHRSTLWSWWGTNRWDVVEMCCSISSQRRSARMHWTAATWWCSADSVGSANCCRWWRHWPTSKTGKRECCYCWGLGWTLDIPMDWGGHSQWQNHVFVRFCQKGVKCYLFELWDQIWNHLIIPQYSNPHL